MGFWTGNIQGATSITFDDGLRFYCDLHHLPSWSIARQPGAFMAALIEQARASDLWRIFTIHGIQELHLPVGDTDFLELVDHLVRRKETVWVAPVAKIAAYVHQKLG